ncbi:MAG: dihydropteroate synthase [Elusimicrobia bacterium]|nr:dihydropteroate synthase [Elusimicrobiota bacterium]
MFIIGEKINGMFKNVSEAIQKKNKSIIQELAKKQIDAGANVLDVNVGPASMEALKDMEWLITTIRETTKCPLAVDTTKIDVMEKGLSIAGPGSFLNSTSGQKEKLDLLLPLVKKYNANVIALTMTKSGVPANAEARMEIAANIVASCMEHNIETTNLYIDAVILPVNVAQDHSRAVLETIKQCKLICDPPPKTILGLSNVSQGCLNRGLVDRTFLVMALASGLDAAILNPLDNELMDAMITAELLLGRQLYCDSYLEAYRKK